MVISEKNKIFLLELLQKRLDKNKIDLKELNSNFYGPYRQLRPYNKCECWALEPDEEMRWHVTHVNECLKDALEAVDFLEKWEDMAKKEGKRFNQEKKQAIERIKNKAREINYKDRFGEDYEPQKYHIFNCRNNQDLKTEEKKQIAHLENLVNTWQKSSEAEKEKSKKQEEERIKQEQQQAQAEEAKKKKQEEEIKQKEQEFKNQVEEEKNKLDPKSNREFNDLKSKFYEIYQKGKKYTWIELMKLQNIISIIEKKIGLDGDLQEAKKELQIIFDKVASYQHETFFIMARGEKVEEILKGMGKQELESCKKALEETEKIIYLSEKEKFLLSKITEKLKINNLDSEIQQLKNQNSGGSVSSEQQTENQKKIAEKEQELEQIRKNNENDNKQHTPKDKDNQNYKNWTYKRLVAEIKKLKTEIESLKRSEDINSPEKKLELRMKLEKEKRRISEGFQLHPINWIVWGGIPLGIVTVFLIIHFALSKKSSKSKSNVNQSLRTFLTTSEINSWLDILKIKLFLAEVKHQY